MGKGAGFERAGEARRALFTCLLIFTGSLAAFAQSDAIGLAKTYYSVPENSGSLTIQIVRTGRMTDYASVHVRTEAGSAGTNDFQFFSREVTFAPGESNLTVTIEILNDALVEGDEWFEIILSDPDPFCCWLAPDSRAVVAIQENDGVQFASAAYSIREDGGQLHMEVLRFGDVTNASLSIPLQILEWNARRGVDFVLATNQVTLEAAQTNATIIISILNDAIPEGPKQFTIRLGLDALCCPLGIIRQTDVTIIDNDLGVEFLRSSYQASEPGGAIEVQVRRVGDPTNEFTVDVELAGTASPGADFVLSTNRLFLPSGTSNLVALLIPVLDDPNVEGPEYVNLYLTNATGGVPLGWQFMCKLNFADNEYAVNMVHPAFDSVSIASVTAALIQPDGKILVATRDDLYRPRLSRLNPDGSLDASFTAVDFRFGTVTALAMQPDGKILAAGDFYYNIARVAADGSWDATFVAPIRIARIRCVQVLPDGKILIGGSITHTNGTRAPIVRLYESGDWDASFNVALNVGTTTQPDLFAIALQADGKIVIGGDFSAVNDDTHFGIVGVLADGSLDPTFNARLYPSAVMTALGQQGDGNLLAVISYARLVRLNGMTGANDPSFQPQLGNNSRIWYLTLQPDGKILLLGELFSLDQNRLGGIVRLNPDGSLDGFCSAVGRVFVASFNGQIFTGDQSRVVRLLPETPLSSFSLGSRKIYAAEGGPSAEVTVLRGGNSSSTLSVDFSTAGDATLGGDFVPSSGTVTFRPLETTKTIAFQPIDDCHVETNETAEITLINPSMGAVISHPGRATLVIVDDEPPGSLDAFNPSLFSVTAIALQPDGRIVVGGKQGIDRLNADGSRDPSFGHVNVGIGGDIYSIVLEPEGEILVGGDGSIIRLRANGTRDGNFLVSAVRQYCAPFHGDCYDVPGIITTLLLQPDGKIIALGDFYKINRVHCRGLARVHPDSTLDLRFTSNAADLWLYPAALQADGKLIGAYGGSLVRLNVDGTRDTNFTVDIFRTIKALAILPDQRILVGSYSASVSNQPRPALERINSDALLDTNFNRTISVEGVGLTHVTAITIGEDGTILLAGQFTDQSVRVLKLDSEGSLIPTFNSGPRFSGPINSIIEQTDGALLVAGSFTNVNSIPRPGIARLKSERSHMRLSPPTLGPDGSLRIVTGSHVGETYVLQKSAELNAWLNVSTNTAVDCTLESIDRVPSPESRFYRVLKID
jgi:uncharacterized delta-60 repeat protein